MKVDNFLDRYVGMMIMDEDEAARAAHKSSGKLSASQLGAPLQWQILKSLGVPQKPIDEYTLRKFKRGKDVEEWLLSHIPGVATKQEEVEYRGAIGFMDAFVGAEDWDFPIGPMPLEIKSVSNAKFKRISTQRMADRGHLLQAAMYALAKGTPHFAISYVATDDYRILTWIGDVIDHKEEIDSIIDTYEAQKATGTVPVFSSTEKWHSDPKYCNYPEWVNLSQVECDEKLEEFLDSKN